MAGEVLGVNTAVVAAGRDSSGPGFALTSNTARNVAMQLLENGRVVRGSIGVTYDPESATITQLRSGGPASLAGLQAGDVIASIDGQEVVDGASLRVLIERQTVGRTVPVTVIRDGNEVALEVGIGDRDVVYAERDPALLPQSRAFGGRF
jgi:S1-C subfamily serine protease